MRHTVNWHSQPYGISGTGTNITFNPSSLAPTTYTVVASASLNTNCFDTCTVTVIKVEVVSVDATSDIGPTKINYRVIPSGVSIPSVTFTAPGMTETRANVNGDFFFTYNQSDLSYGSSEITFVVFGL